MKRRKNARIAGESFFQKNVQSPQASPCNGKTRSTVSRYRFINDFLNDISSPTKIMTKLFWRLLIHDAMPVAMTTNLVTFQVNLSNQLRKSLSHPTEDKKGSP